MNDVTLIGRVGRDPQSIGKGETTIAYFTLATNEGKDRVNWHHIKAFNQTAKSVLDHVIKGKWLAIKGAINNFEYEKDGVKRNGTEILASKIEFVGDKPRTEINVAQAGSPTLTSSLDDLPF